jgi:uncharacterized protein YrzB (UPF0473 family)
MRGTKMDEKKNLDETVNDDQFLTLEWEDGSAVECEIIDQIDLDGKQYIALLPRDEDQAIIFSYKEIAGEIELGNLEDEEFKKVSEAFMADFTDEEAE